MKRVPVAPFREAFERSGMSASEVCRRLGWIDSRGKPESTRLLRSLGLKDHYHRDGVRRLTQNIDYERAVRIARALDVDPVDVGV